ncbi:MAG: hypothetical protein GY785_06645 [Gammaproteobacteria bacterium]|nr:hypothetical protein [Gammaproteobacteria bacterium]MCP4979077.1 hypothetical protein [Gammaproteobacteria bacterium]
MLTIKRSCSYKIITRAVQLDGMPLVALLNPNADDCEPYLDRHQLQTSLNASPDAIIVYNQQAEALALVKSLCVPASQIFIEIRQDTKGVLGLHAMRRRDHDPETLELIYQ